MAAGKSATTAVVMIALLCGGQVMAVPGLTRQLLQNSSASSFANAFTDGQTSIYNALTMVSSSADANSFMQAAASAYAKDEQYTAQGYPSCEGDYGQEFGKAMARASSSNTQSTAQALAAAASDGGNSLMAMSVAIAVAFAIDPVHMTAAFALAIAQTGCDNMKQMLSMAQSVAQANGRGAAFASAVSSSVSISSCLNGNSAQANSEAQAAAGGSSTSNAGR